MRPIYMSPIYVPPIYVPPMYMPRHICPRCICPDIYATDIYAPDIYAPGTIAAPGGRAMSATSRAASTGLVPLFLRIHSSGAAAANASSETLLCDPCGIAWSPRNSYFQLRLPHLKWSSCSCCTFLWWPLANRCLLRFQLDSVLRPFARHSLARSPTSHLASRIECVPSVCVASGPLSHVS